MNPQPRHGKTGSLMHAFTEADLYPPVRHWLESNNYAQLERFKFAFARGSGKENQRNSDFSRKKCEFDDSTPHLP